MTTLDVWERYEVRIRNLGPENSFDWLAEIPELDGCRAYGETREAALEALKAVAGVYVRVRMEDDNPLPLPLQEVPSNYSGRFVVRVSPSLHRSLSNRAQVEGVSLNHLCSELLALGIGTGSVLSQAITHRRQSRRRSRVRYPTPARQKKSPQPE